MWLKSLVIIKISRLCFKASNLGRTMLVERLVNKNNGERQRQTFVGTELERQWDKIGTEDTQTLFILNILLHNAYGPIKVDCFSI